MPNLHTIYNTMKSLEYKMDLAGERTVRIGRIVAHEQNSATAMLPEPTGRKARREYAERCAYWRTEVRFYGWQDGLAS